MTDEPEHCRFRGWVRPGSMPPGGVEPGPGETLDSISGHFRIVQYRDGHRFSTGDVLTAWYGDPCGWRAPAKRALIIRRGDGTMHPEYAAVRLSCGLPPGPIRVEDVP